MNAAPDFAASVDMAAVLDALARSLVIRKAGIFLTAFPSERIKLPFLTGVSAGSSKIQALYLASPILAAAQPWCTRGHSSLLPPFLQETSVVQLWPCPLGTELRVLQVPTPSQALTRLYMVNMADRLVLAYDKIQTSHH